MSAAAGVTWTAGVGEQVTAGQPLLELQTDDAARIPRALEALEGAIGVDTDDQPAAADPRPHHRPDTARTTARFPAVTPHMPSGARGRLCSS